MKKYIKYLIYLLILLAVGVGFYKKVYIPKHTFKTIKPVKGNMKIVVNGIGNVGAKNIYKIGSTYGGKVLDFTFNEGDYIKKGELVANIDSIDLIDNINGQKALREKIVKDIFALEIDKKSAVVNFNYQNEVYTKNKKLYKLHSISSLDYQKYLTLKNSAKLNIESADAHIASLKKQIKQIDTLISGLEKRLQRYRVFSPVSGYITRKLIAEYQNIIPNQTLIEVVNPKDVWVKAYIDTRVSGKVKIGDNATIKLRSSDKLYKGEVVQINPVNNPITYEREIDIGFKKSPMPFYLEEQAGVKIDIDKVKNIVKIPVKSISFYKEKDGVWILRGDRVYFKPVKIVAYKDKTVGVKGIGINSLIVIPDSKKTSLKDGLKIYHD